MFLSCDQKAKEDQPYQGTKTHNLFAELTVYILFGEGEVIRNSHFFSRILIIITVINKGFHMVPESLPSSFHVLTCLILKMPYEIGTIIVPTLQMKKLRHKEVIKFCKDTQL